MNERLQIASLFSLHQTEVAGGRRQRLVARDRAKTCEARLFNGLPRNPRVTRRPDPVQDRASNGQLRPQHLRARQGQRSRPGLPRSVQHHDHRRAQRSSQISGGPTTIGGPIEQTYRSFDHQILNIQPTNTGADLTAAHRPGVEIDRYAAARRLVKPRIDVIWPRFRSRNAKAAIAHRPQQAERHNGFAGARGRGGDEKTLHPAFLIAAAGHGEPKATHRGDNGA